MNTDNTSISGETIDYGPCAYMDTYSPGKVFSSIDHGGRYAYNRQPDIMVWNLAQLATALLPVMDMDRDEAIEAATASVHRFPGLFGDAWLATFRAKLGLKTIDEDDADLSQSLLDRMAASQADFTNTFRALGRGDARDQCTPVPRRYYARGPACGARRGQPLGHSAQPPDRRGNCLSGRWRLRPIQAACECAGHAVLRANRCLGSDTSSQRCRGGHSDLLWHLTRPGPRRPVHDP